MILDPLFFFSKFIFSYKKISDWAFPLDDVFIKQCVKWEKKNEAVILTLKNDKSYIGYLMKYPESIKLKSEHQTISIAPLLSGCRNNTNKQVDWTTKYPEDNKDLEIIIPRSEIITFGKFNKDVFNYFYPTN